MPRKTRKQKITAHKRKSVVHASSVPLMDTPVVQSQKNTASAQNFKVTSHSSPLSEAEKALRSHTVVDITKTIIIISLLFAAQAGVYFAQRTGLLAGWLQ